MGGGKSTTMLVAEYFFHLASGLVISISGRDFTSGSASLSVLIREWLAGMVSNAHTAAMLRSIPYSASPSSSLLDLIAVAADHEELCTFIFEKLISELKTQQRCCARHKSVAAVVCTAPPRFPFSLHPMAFLC